MDNTTLILVEDFCSHFQISNDFIEELAYAGLVQITILEEKSYFPAEQLKEVEKLTRLHEDLEINQSGIEAIAHLLQQLETLQKEMNVLRQKLSYFETKHI